MGWTRRADALELMARRRATLRRGLRKADGLDRDEAWSMLFEYEKLDSALARGHRDGVVKTETGVDLGYKSYDIGPLVDELLSLETTLTWRL